MNIKTLPLVLLFLSLSVFASAQEKVCGAEHPEEMGLLMNEATAHRVQQIELFTQQWISENQNQVSLREVISIPVVVHVVWMDESDNFSDLEIEAQIDGLTADFRKMNDNAAIIPSIFRPLAADVEIEFCMASVNPAGKATNGIVRRETSVPTIASASSSGIRRIFHTNLGGSDAWDPGNYINIWVGQMTGNFLGEATMPGQADSPWEDGVIIDSDHFGFFCSSTNNYFLGRTLTHEMGHFFNLFHTWGKVGCDVDDLVDDTPNQYENYLGCPSYPKVSCESEDMFMNFMDYVDDNCMAMFTHGQKMRMLAALNDSTSRASLKNSMGCALISPPDVTLTPDDIFLFPNPATDCVHIDLDLDNNLPIKMAIFNTAGQVIYTSQIFVKDLRTFDISNMSNGIYFISFETNDQVASKKLIIDR